MSDKITIDKGMAAHLRPFALITLLKRQGMTEAEARAEVRRLVDEQHRETQSNERRS